MNKHCSLGREPKAPYRNMTDRQKIEYFKKELETRTGLTAAEWDAYNGAQKRIDPAGYAAEKAAIHKKIDIRNAKERLTIEDLEQIIAEKRAENTTQSKGGSE